MKLRAARARRSGRRAAFFIALLCGLFVTRAVAMQPPDSLGLVRLARLAGPSGAARMRVERGGTWVVYAGVSFDSTGLRAGVPRQEVGPVTDVWTEPAPATDIAWSDITRLQVLRPANRSRAPLIGAVVGGVVSLPVIGGWPEGPALKPLEAVGVFAMFAVLGALAGKGLSVINPFRGPEWMEFP